MRDGRQCLVAGCIARHRHAAGYAAIVLSGRYEEMGDAGRWQVEPGDILVHRPYESHLNRIARRGAQVLNLRLPAHATLPTAFRVACPDQLVALSRAGPDVMLSLLEPLQLLQPVVRDWPDLLAMDLRTDPGLRIGAWARSRGLAAATVSRGFNAAYGATPAGYRSAVRTQRAWHQIVNTEESLTRIAHGGGFADQAHFTRAVRALTGIAPSAWRTSNSFKRDGQHQR